MRRAILPVLAGALVFLVGAIHADPPFHFTSIDVPGAMATNAQGINPEGDIVGIYVDATGKQHGFLLRDGQFETLDFPGATLTNARGISPDGDIVGSYSTFVGNPPPATIHGFLLRLGNYSEVQFPGHLGTIAQRITPNGDILGCLHDTDLMGAMSGFIRTASGYSSIPGIPASMNNGATPDGNHIVGLYTDMMTGMSHGYTIDFGTLTSFDVPASVSTNGWDMNPERDIVGVFTDTNKRVHGFLRASEERRFDGSMSSDDDDYTSIDYPGAIATRAFGINPEREIVGAYVDSANKTHGFLLSRRDDRHHDGGHEDGYEGRWDR